MFQIGFDPTDYRSVGIGDCLDCEDCTGMCREVYEATFLPDILLGKEVPAG